MTYARMLRDEQDNMTLLWFLQDRSPFQQDSSLLNIDTSVKADNLVNKDKVNIMKCKIHGTMRRKNVAEFTFKKKEQVIAMVSKVSPKVEGKFISVDSQLLFQHFILAAGSDAENIAETFKFELSSHPSSLFDPNGLLQEVKKICVS